MQDHVDVGWHRRSKLDVGEWPRRCITKQLKRALHGSFAEDSFEQLSQTTTLRAAASSALLPLRRDFPASFVGDGGLPQTLPQGAQC